MNKYSILFNKYSGFKISEVQSFADVSARKLHWWEQQGLIKPSSSPCRKRWQARRYNLRDVICILVVKSLREKGLSLKKIRESVERIKVTGIENPLANLRVSCLLNTVIFKKDGKYFEPISGQLVIEQALEVIRPKVDRRRLSQIKMAVKKANLHYEQKVVDF